MDGFFLKIASKASRFFLVLLLLGFLPLSGMAEKAQPAELKALHLTRHSARDVQITFDFTYAPNYHYFTLANPERLVIDFVNTKSAAHLPTLGLTGTPVKKVRTGNPKDSTFRVVFELAEDVRITNSANKRQIILDVIPTKNYTRGAPSPSPAPTPPPVVKSMPPLKVKAPLPATPKKGVSAKVSPILGRDIIVLIDAGHGGKDPGALGQRGIAEKNVVLEMARELERQIDRQPGMKAVLSRRGDYYVTLRDRLQIARQYKADIFVAIHADAFRNTYSSGASVYALSLKGASNEAARWLAAKENYSELGGVNLAGKNDMLRSVLIDLSQTATIGASLELGQSVLQQMGQLSVLHHSRVEQAPFMVLKSPDIPSILIETGFLSNPKEEKKLMDYRYQQQLARSIKDGILAYVKQHPAPGTLIAEETSSGKVIS